VYAAEAFPVLSVARLQVNKKNHAVVSGTGSRDARVGIKGLPIEVCHAPTIGSLEMGFVLRPP